MTPIAYIICPNCGHQIGGGQSATWQVLIPFIVCVVSMTVCKILTGKWLP